MPYANEHSCRLRDPGDFQSNSFRRYSREHEGKRYDVIAGRLKDEDTMTDQAYRYPKDIWTVDEARAHCTDHDGILFEPASGEEDSQAEGCCGERKLSANDANGTNKVKMPIRCFEGTAKPHEPFWRWMNAVDQEEPEMELYGYISEYSWFEDDVTPKIFKDQLYRNGKGGPITIRMNSGGGDAIAASAMRSMLVDYPGRVTVRIDGLAASAATLVATAGDVVKMQDTAYYMIHDPLAVFFLAMLNIEELSRLTDSLKAIKEGIVNAYVGRTGMSRERLGKMMTNETWMDAQRAVDLGFADEVVGTSEKTVQVSIPQNAAVINAIHNYRNVPPALMSRLTDEMRRQVRSLDERVQSILKKE